MKLKKKELVILIPLAVLAIIVVVSALLHEEEQEIIIATQCQEGWFKYETGSATLCSKTELTQRQIDEYGK